MLRKRFLLHVLLSVLAVSPFHFAYADNANPIVIWNFNEGSGTTTKATIIAGTSTYTATAIVSNYYSAWTPSYGGGGTAIDFHGTGGEGVAFPDNSFGYAIPDPAKFGSLNFHLKLNSRAKDQVIFSADVKDSSGRYQVVHVNTLGQLVISWRNGYGSTLFEIISAESIDVGAWHYVSIARGLGATLLVTVDSRVFTLSGATASPAWFNEFLGTNVSYHLGVAKNRDFTGVLNGAVDEVTYPYNTLTAVTYVPEEIVISVSPLPVITLTATKTAQTSVNVAAIKWSTKNADFCDATGDWTKGNVGKKGTYYFTMPTTTLTTATFSLLCFSSYGVSSATTTLTVLPIPVKVTPPPPPAPLPPPPPAVVPPPPTLEMMLAAAPPPPPPSTEPVYLGDIKYATENATGLLYVQWTTNVSATSKLSYRVEGDAGMTKAVTDPFPSKQHDGRISVTPGKLVVVRLYASDTQGISQDTKEYRFIAPDHFSDRNVFAAGGISATGDEIAPIIPVAEVNEVGVVRTTLPSGNDIDAETYTDTVSTSTTSYLGALISMQSIMMLLVFLVILGILLVIQYRRREFPFANKLGEGVKTDHSN